MNPTAPIPDVFDWFDAPDDLAALQALRPEEPLTPVQRQLRQVAEALLAPLGIVVRSVEALPFGLRLYLGYAQPQESPETGRLVLYHSRGGRWTRTVGEGRPTPLAATAARHLVAPNDIPVMPLW